MHEVQDKVKNAKELSDAALIEVVISSWEVVCAENEAQKHLVSEAQFNQWTAFRNETGLKLHETVDFADETLTTEQRKYLVSIAGFIANATHKSEAEIIAESEKAEAEAKRAKSTMVSSEVETKTTLKEKKVGFLARLKKLFS
jgi:hypothetical protein